MMRQLVLGLAALVMAGALARAEDFRGADHRGEILLEATADGMVRVTDRTNGEVVTRPVVRMSLTWHGHDRAPSPLVVRPAPGGLISLCRIEPGSGRERVELTARSIRLVVDGLVDIYAEGSAFRRTAGQWL